MDQISRKEAIRSGAPRYFTGRPCRNGHISCRNTSTRKCLECHRTESTARYHRNIEKERDRSKRYHAANKEKRKEQRAIYYLENRDAIFEKHKEWMGKNREKWDAYIEANKHMLCFYSSQYRARKLNATPPWITAEDLQRIAEIYEQAKTITEQTGIEHHVDHIIPLKGKSISGLHIPENLQILTKEDNLKKSNQWAAQ